MVLQKGKIMVDENIAGVVPVVDDKIQKKAKTARVLGFVAMGLSIVSIAMLFLPIVTTESFLGLSAGINLVDLGSIIQSIDGAVDVMFIVAVIADLVLPIVSAVLDIFKNKPCKVISCILNGVTVVISLVFIIMIFANGEGVLKPGIGLWLNTVLLLTSFVLTIIAAAFTAKKVEDISGFEVDPNNIGGSASTTVLTGRVTFTSGCCAGYSIPVVSGERLVIGKDPAQCSIVIDRSYKKVSRVHCIVEYDTMQDIYIVTDRSTNGTSVVGGHKLQPNSPSYLQAGTLLNLAGTDNTFKLG